MHSSRMRTGRSLTVFQILQLGGVPGTRGVYLVLVGVYLVRGVPGPGGCTWSRGVPGPGVGCTWFPGGVPGQGGVPGPGGVPRPGGVYLVPGQVLPPVNRMTNRCKNITLAKTSFRPVKILLYQIW